MTVDSTRQSESGVSRVCHTVVSDVAAAVGTDSEELQPPLYEVVEPEALEQLFHRPDENPGDPTGHVVFDYVGCRVTVYSNGQVHVSPPEETTARSSGYFVGPLPEQRRDGPNR